ncbi:unnamed protein product [Acanthosepion pharaonis]|uniref:Uncharacterized protein n=1 Tax=Acanthosepion pharaonis TaxID=158019 RepID=A0A812E0B9_ACAPH|nr:unnamed protein product [Sepia pharaonis]
MRSGLADDIQQIDDARKTAVIDRELSRLGNDIACLQETRLADSDIPRSRHWYQLDLVITRREDLRIVLHTGSFHSADCDTDHSLVGCKVRLTAKRIDCSKTKGLPLINSCRANDPGSSRRFQTTFSAKVDTSSFSATDIDSRWHHLCDAIYTSALTAFVKKDRRNAGWYEAHWDEMKPVSEAKRQALLAYKHNPCVNTRDALRVARSRAQQTARGCANNYWLNLCSTIQTSADSGNARGMYTGIKTATGITPITTAPLKSKTGEVITDRGKQLERWVEHYLELYETQNMVTDAALDALPSLPVMEELDAPSSAEEHGKAIDCLSCGRAPGRDGIPSEFLKSGKPALLNNSTRSCTCTGRRTTPSETCEMPTLSPSASSGKSLPASSCHACRVSPPEKNTSRTHSIAMADGLEVTVYKRIHYFTGCLYDKQSSRSSSLYTSPSLFPYCLSLIPDISLNHPSELLNYVCTFIITSPVI